MVVKTLARQDIYETQASARDIPDKTRVRTHVPECDGRVTTNAVETICEDCGLIIDEQRKDRPWPEWEAREEIKTSESGRALLTAARHDRGLSTEIGRRKDAGTNKLWAKRQRLSRKCAGNRLVVGSVARAKPRAGWSEVRRIASVLELSGSVRDQACQLFGRSNRRPASRAINRGDSGVKHLRSLSL